MLTIRVGKEPFRIDFVAHQSVLTSRSEFFRAAMTGNWSEANSRVVKLPEDSPPIVALYLNYIYTGQLTTMRKTEEELSTLQVQECVVYVNMEYHDLFPLYILAEKFQDAAAKNAALIAAPDVTSSKCADKRWVVPSFEMVNRVYE